MKDASLADIDYVIIHFNGASRTECASVDATAVHPVSEKCEIFLKKYGEEKDIQNVNGVVTLKEHGSRVLNALNEEGFIEAEFFVDDICAGMINVNQD